MAVITISRQYGSGGDEVASRVCELLGYRRFDNQMISKMAAEVGLTEQEIMDYTEESHKVRSFLDRLFGAPPTMVETRSWRETPGGERVAEYNILNEDTVRILTEKAIQSAYRTGNMVIVGRGGQVILAGQLGVLHVRIEAPLEDRIQRLKQQIKTAHGEYTADLHGRRMAQDEITCRDEASADYLRRYYQVDWGDKLFYHVVLNTGKMSVEQAAQTIVLLAREVETELDRPVSA